MRAIVTKKKRKRKNKILRPTPVVCWRDDKRDLKSHGLFNAIIFI